MKNIDRAELAKLPYLRTDDLQGRTVRLMPMWDSTEWFSWVPTSGGLLRLRPGACAQGLYLAENAECETDLFVPFLQFMIQRAYWPDVTHWVSAIESDIQNLGTALAKIDLFHSVRKQIGELNVGYYVGTDFEYILGVCRSVFDLLQEVVKRLWSKVTALHPTAKKSELPQSFAAMISAREQATGLGEKYGLPEALSECYANAADFLVLVRRLRDGIMHGGKDGPRIYVGDEGFSIDRNLRAFAELGVWTERSYLNEDLASLRPVLAHLVIRTVSICSDFGTALENMFPFPSEIAPGYCVFMRGPHNEAFVRAMKVLEGETWWTESATVL